MLKEKKKIEAATLKQINHDHFWKMLNNYKEALKRGESIAMASVLVYSSLNREGVPGQYRILINKAYREARRKG